VAKLDAVTTPINIDHEIIDQILNHRLHQADIKRILDTLTSTDREDFMGKIADILGKVTALLEVSNQLSDTLALDEVLERIISITTEAITTDRGTLFLHDRETNELYSRVAKAEKEIRIPATAGIAGEVFTTGKAVIIPEAYADPRFNQEVDQQTGYQTRNIMCAPIRTRSNDIIGVTQLLNKDPNAGGFDLEDLQLLESITSQASAALQNAQLFAEVEKQRRQETQMLEMTTAISSELHLDPLLQRIMETTTLILDADRSTLFIHDERTDELWSRVAQGLTTNEIRFPSRVGIAGSVLHSGETVNIEDAYEDDRFNQNVDKKTGYRTKSVLCMPIVNKLGKAIGVAQVLNKDGGPFNAQDEKKLKAFCSQAAVAIENAMLFDEVLNIKNYNESILRSLTNGVITLNADLIVETCNEAALRILHEDTEKIIGVSATEYFGRHNDWINESIARVQASNENDTTVDAEIVLASGDVMSINLSLVPLLSLQNELIGTMLVFEDITSEKRMKGTLARYMTKEVADQLMESDAMLGGQLQKATVFFSDIRSFTTISERIGAAETVSLLNEYFTLTVDVIFNNKGILDKYIGDAMLAVFGVPFTSGADEDHAVTAGLETMRILHQFNDSRTAAGKDTINVGIGISTAEVLAGNIGSMKRMDYTVIGDGVNLASRLEGANKYYSTNILISESTYRKLTGDYLARQVDLMQVKGKNEPITVYEILDHENGNNSLRESVEIYNAARGHYRSQSWDKGIAMFEQATACNDSDGLSRMYIDRCRHFKENPPPADWDGVWVMTGK
jgi:adenylate cyclase